MWHLETSLAEALVEGSGDGLAVHVLADEDEFLHAVAVGVVPVALEVGGAAHEVEELVVGHSGVPLAGVAQRDLLAGLLEEVAGVGFGEEPANAFGADDAGGPVAGNELVEARDVHGFATVVDEGGDAVFFGLAFVMVMVVVVLQCVIV